jgi:hypothetical protein
LRAEVVKLAARPDASTPLLTPSREIAAVDPTTVATEPATVAVDPATLVMSRDWDKDTRIAVPVPASVAEVTRTDTTSVTGPSIVVPAAPRSRWMPLVYVGVGVVVATGIFMLVSLASHGASDSTAAVPPPPPAVTFTASAAAKSEPSAVPIASAELPPPVIASAHPAPPPPTVVTRPHAKPTTAATSSQPTLPRSPYEAHP